MTERERRAMLRGRPDVTCWGSFLTEVAARRAGAAQSVPVAAAAPSAPALGPVALPMPLVQSAARSVPVTRPERLSAAA